MSQSKKTIDKLVCDLCPTKTVFSPIKKFLIWVLGIMVTVIGLVFLGPVRPDLVIVLANPIFLLEAFLLHSAFFMGSYHLFANAVPGLQKVRLFPKIAVVFLMGWGALLVTRAFLRPMDLWGACHNAWPCIGQGIVLNMVAAFLLIAFFRRHCVSLLSYVLPGLLLSATFGTAILQWTCETMNPLHLLIAHGGPMLGMMGLLYLLFMWKRRQESVQNQ